MKKRGFTVRIGPLAMSLAAAAVTAVAFAAVSLADNGSSNVNDSGARTDTFTAPAPPGAGGGAGVFFRDNLSDADKQKLEDFRNCMEANGAPGPPDPGHFDPSNPPKPPSAADQDKLQKAFEACKDKLPEDMQKMGPPRIGTCGAPPPGAPGDEQGSKQNQ
jgi:hypothetical protein